MKHLTWKVDHDAKIIWLTVRLALWRSDGKKPDDDFTSYVEGFTGGNWQSGLKFACYELRIVVKCRAVADEKSARPDEVPVQVDWAGPSEVDGNLTPDAPLSDDPSQLFVPIRGRFNPTENAAWQHELGHILGLDDGYRGEPGKPRVDGHPADMMWQNTLPLSAETVTRMVRRNGQVDESKLRCALSFDATPGDLFMFLAEVKGLSVHAWSCRWLPPSSDPQRKGDRVEFTGTVNFAAGYLMGDQNADLRDFVEKLTGVPTGPLADSHSVSIPVTFDIGPGQHELLSIKAGDGLLLEGDYSWDAGSGMPVMHGPLRLNGMSTAAFFPGPPVQGYFTDGAKECAR
jgi:hypothetical protein